MWLSIWGGFIRAEAKYPRDAWSTVQLTINSGSVYAFLGGSLNWVPLSHGLAGNDIWMPLIRNSHVSTVGPVAHI